MGLRPPQTASAPRGGSPPTRRCGCGTRTLLASLTEAERATLRVRVLMGQLLDALAHEEAIRRPNARAAPSDAGAP
jgi:hypothetical protein